MEEQIFLVMQTQVTQTQLKPKNVILKIYGKKGFWLKVLQVKMVLKSSHNHIRVTTKLQNNHYSEPPEIQLNKRLTTKDMKKNPHRDQQGAEIDPTPMGGG